LYHDVESSVECRPYALEREDGRARHAEARLPDLPGASCDDAFVNCPNCGAPMELSVRHGHYVCRHCGTFQFPHSVDSQGIRVLGPSETGWACPLCEQPLMLAMLDGQQVHHCTTCRGVLLPREAFAELVRRRRSWAAGPPVIPIPPDPDELRRELTCPRCRGRLTVDRYYGPGNIVMDQCVACDWVWLDFGELKQIADAPGVDRRPRDPS
jgi:Zn-finger nucleic acid-binding protein